MIGSALNTAPDAIPADLSQLSAEQRRALEHRLGAAGVAELAELAHESDRQMFFEGLLDFGRRLEASERLEAASAVYSLISEGTGCAAIEARAVAEWNAMRGVGATGPRAEFLLRRLAREASDPAMILSMGLAGAAFRVTRFGLLGRLAASPTANFFTRGFGARATAGLGAFLVESTTFTAAGHGLREAFGQNQDWSLRALGRDWLGGTLTLGSLRVFGWAGGSLYRRARGLNAVTAPAAPTLGQVFFQQASMLSGIYAAQGLETAVGLRERRDGATHLVDGLATLLQFHVAGRLSHAAFGEGWNRWERQLELGTQALSRDLEPRRPGTPPFGAAGLAWAGNAGTARRFGAGPEPLNRPWLVLMEGDEGVQAVENGRTRPSSESIAPGAVDSVPANGNTGDVISWLPKSPRELEIALREFLNMHPHAATVFELTPGENGGPPVAQILMINRRMTEMFGYPESEALGVPLRQFMMMRDLPFFRDLAATLVLNGTLELREIRFRHKDGHTIWCDVSGMVKRVNDRTLGFAFLDNISDRRNAAEELRATQVRNQALIGAIPDLIFRVRRDMTFLDFRTPQPGLFPVPPEQLIGMNIADLPVPEELKQIAYGIIGKAFESGEFQRIEYELPMPDGSIRYQEARINPSGPHEVVIISRDMTDIRRAEQHRIAGERLDALQLISRGLAHDANNALTANISHVEFARYTLGKLQGILETLAQHPEIGKTDNLAEEIQAQLLQLRRLQENKEGRSRLVPSTPVEIFGDSARVLDEVIADLAVAGEQGDRIKQLLMGFRELTADPVAGPPFDPHSLLRASDLRAILGSGPELNLRLSPDSLQVPGPRESLSRVVLNLVGNARDAMEGRSQRSLTVETEMVRLTAEDLERMAQIQPGVPQGRGGRFMKLRISDTGGGISPEALPRIFEPYFSTKAKAHDSSGHSGLGLAITRKIVRDTGGFILVESRLGEGTSFEVYLPEARTVIPREDPALTERILATPLLVVDDEPTLASALSRNLGLEGFQQIHVAHNGADALRLLQEHPGIGGMIFDKQLPDMSGLQLLRRARSLRPNLPSLLFTGEDADAMRPYLGDHTDALGKPGQMPQIRTSLFNLLGNYFKAQSF